MAAQKGTLRTCNKGHKYYKTSDCPVCPLCEKQRSAGVFDILSAPARRALENNGITTPEQLAMFSEKEILTWHGMGPASIPKLRIVLKDKGLFMKKQIA